MKHSIGVLAEPVEDWIQTAANEPEEFILEVLRPRRTVVPSRISPNRNRFTSIDKEDAIPAADPKAIGESVREITRREPTMLRSAGAIAFLATAKELTQVAALPGVKAIRFNRRFGQ